jgi:hypothetical protein
LPQLAAASCAQSLSGSAPDEIGPQVPSAPTPFLPAEHAWQRPVQLELQQTPSTQKPEEQSAPEAQTAPLPSKPTQTLFAHEYPAAQSLLFAHVVLHMPFAQPKGAQFVAIPLAMHVPAPSHVSGWRFVPLQTAPQLVPAA